MVRVVEHRRIPRLAEEEVDGSDHSNQQNSAHGAGEDEGPTLGDRMADGGASAANVDYDRRAFRQKLEAALDELPDKQREVFVLREFSGLKYREIADTVGCKVPTVKSRMRYALKALRGHLADYVDHSFDKEERMEVAVPEE